MFGIATKNEKIAMQHECFAVKACHMMGKTIDETARLLCMDRKQIAITYKFIEQDMIDFDSEI